MVYRIHDEPDMERVNNFADFAGQMGYPLSIESPEQVKPAFGKMLKAAEGKPESDILQQLVNFEPWQKQFIQRIILGIMV